MADVLITFQCSACGKISDPPFHSNGSWIPKRDFIEVMKVRGWKITRSNKVLCKECHMEMVGHNRSIAEQISEKRKDLILMQTNKEKKKK